MRFKLTIKHLLACMLIVSVGVVLQMRLNRATSAFADNLSKPEFKLHRDAVIQIGTDYPAILNTNYSTSVDNLIVDSDPSLIDYCLFRRTVQFRYNLNINYLGRQIAHSRIPAENRIDDLYVEIPLTHQAKQVVRILATPFGCKIRGQ